MRIAYVCADPGVPVFGRKGCSIHVQEVMAALVKRGLQVHVFATRLGASAPPALQHVTVHELPKVRGDTPEQRERSALAINHDLRRALAAAGAFDAIYERYSLWSYAAMDHAAESSIAGLLEVNAPLIEEQLQHRELADRAAATRVAQRVFTAASAVLAVSEEVASYVRQFQRDPLRVHVVPNAVDPSRFGSHVRACRPAPPDVFTVGFVGNMRPWHGLPLLIDAFELFHRRHRQTRLLLVGGGQEMPAVQDEIARRGLGDVTVITGPVDRDDVPSLLASMDVAVAPYPARSDFYFSPLKVYEYMAAALPTVASAIGQLSCVIGHERHGLLVPAGDATAMAHALARFYDDPALRHRLGRAARDFVVRHHTWDQVAERILQLAREALPCPPKRDSVPTPLERIAT